MKMNTMFANRLAAVFMAVTLLCSAFTGCGRQDAHGGDFSADKAPSGTETPAYVADVDPVKSRIVYDTLDDGYIGVYGSTQPFDTDQYYFRITKDNGTKYGATFTGTLDENNQQVVLCTKTGCTHTDETCPAYIDLIGGYFTLGGKLYFYSPALYDYSTDSLNGTVPRIRLFSVDNGGKQLFTELEGYTQTEGTVVTDGTYIYLTAQQERDRDIYLIQIDMSGGAVHALYKMPPRLDLFEYRLCSITADGNQLVFTARDRMNIEDYKIGVYTISSGGFEIKHSLPADEYKLSTEKGLVACYSVIGHYLYQFDMDTGNLTRQRIGTEETEIVIENIRSLTGEPHHITMGYAYGNKVVLTCFAGEKHKLSTATYYVLDTDTFAVTPLNITAGNTTGVNSLIRIFSATPEYFVVATDTTNYSALANEMALISKADFYADNRQFMPIGVINY